MNISATLGGDARALTLAVLVDGENIPPATALPAVARACAGHKAPIRRVYGSPVQAGA